jgi:hypothetical protein
MTAARWAVRRRSRWSPKPPRQPLRWGGGNSDQAWLGIRSERREPRNHLTGRGYGKKFWDATSIPKTADSCREMRGPARIHSSSVSGDFCPASRRIVQHLMRQHRVWVAPRDIRRCGRSRRRRRLKCLPTALSLPIPRDIGMSRWHLANEAYANFRGSTAARGGQLMCCKTLRYATDKERDFRNWLIGVLRPLPGVRPSHEVAYHALTKQDATPTPSKRFTRNSTRSTRLRQQGAISAAEPSTIRQPCSITFLAWTRRKPLRRRQSRTFRGFD